MEGNRVLATPTIGVLDYKLHVYVRQGEGSGGVEQIELNALDTPEITSATWPETGGAATVVCEAIVLDGAATSPNSYFEFAEGQSRSEIGANDLPPSIQVSRGSAPRTPNINFVDMTYSHGVIMY